MVPQNWGRKKIVFSPEVLAYERRFVFLATVQSTGTWFCINLLKSHSKITWVAPEAEWDFGRLKTQPGITVFHSHFETVRKSDYIYGDFLKKDAMMESWIQKANHTVITMRDPLKSIITAYIRGREFDRLGQVRGFVKAIEFIEKYNIFVFPIDLYNDEAHRYRLIIGLFEYLQLESEPFMLSWAKDWPIHNSTKHKARDEVFLAYENRDLKTIESKMPKEYAALIEAKPIIQPFMKKLGYKEFIW